MQKPNPPKKINDTINKWTTELFSKEEIQMAKKM
jgi:hypothetical protein